MTALKPIEGRLVRAALAADYPSNKVCAHPECTEKVQLRSDAKTPTVHHIFPRGWINGDSYFVEIEDVDSHEKVTLPHAIGLCGSGTTGHHGDVEEHRAWIKLEDGVYNWYDRVQTGPPCDCGDELGCEDGDEEGCNLAKDDEWKLLGPLNPQPGSVEAKPKRRVLKGEAKRSRANWQIKVPKDNLEDGAGILDELFEAAWKHAATAGGLPVDEGTPYTQLCAVFAAVLQS